jgi:hypothetical protein
VLLCGLWLGANLAYRAEEVPAGGEPFDLAALRKRIADPDEVRVGQAIREAVNQSKEHPWGQDQLAAMGADKLAAILRREEAAARHQVPDVIEQGWEAATPEFQNWLEQLTADPWPARMAAAAKQPPGVFIAPTDEASGRNDATDCRQAAQLLAARALQLQAGGANDKALDYLGTVLALSRHLRHQAPAYAYLEGVETERVALVGLDHWLNRVGRRPDLLRRALDELTAHEAAVPPVTEALAGEYLRFRNGLGNAVRGAGHLSSDAEAMLMQVPWEAERARRLGDAVFAGRRLTADAMAEAGYLLSPSDDGPLADWLPGTGGPTRERLGGLVRSSWLAPLLPVTAPVQRAAQLSLCRVRAGHLQVALALYQAEHGRAAASLDDLVPALLPELPEDPFAHRPFRYRVSKGERVIWIRDLPGGGKEAVREVPAGQGILWSAGPDGSDDGGQRQVTPDQAAAGADLIFLVPR